MKIFQKSGNKAFFMFFIITALMFAFINSGYSYQVMPDSLQSNLVILPVPTLGSSPETGFYLGAAVLISFRSPKAQHTTLSTAKIEATYTFNKQIIFDLDHYIFSKSKKFLYQGKNTFRYYPEKFYGIGNSTPASNELWYDYKLIDLDNSVYYSLRNNLYLGISYRFQNIFDLQYPDEFPFVTDEIIGLDGGISSGLGFS
ncbi:MAG: hypothetical protein U9R19_17870, partial [Bacteroidota bacterium]|nr:hypothetical protein [Bacteroidota bacterium]